MTAPRNNTGQLTQRFDVVATIWTRIQKVLDSNLGGTPAILRLFSQFSSVPASKCHESIQIRWRLFLLVFFLFSSFINLFPAGVVKLTPLHIHTHRQTHGATYVVLCSQKLLGRIFKLINLTLCFPSFFIPRDFSFGIILMPLKIPRIPEASKKKKTN